MGGRRATPNPVEIITEPIQIEIYHPPLPKAIQLERPDWFVVSEKNIDEFLEKLSKIQGVEKIPTFFALSPQGYEKMSGNLQEMRRYILEQKEIIVYYKKVTTPEEPTQIGNTPNRPSIGLYPRDKE
jgi:adenylyl- and sulfurtransferase ThiI